MKVIRSPRFLVYMLLLILLSASVAFYSTAQTSLSENLFATALGMVITVLVIDTLLEQDKIRRYRSLNKSNTRNVVITVALSLISARNDLGDPKNYKIDDVEISTHELNALFDADLENLVNSASPEQLGKFCNTIFDAAKSIDKSLDKIAPYPSVKAKGAISDLAIQSGVLSELLKIYSGMSEITKDAIPADKETEVLKILESSRRRNYVNKVTEMKDSLVELHKLASKNCLQEII